MKRSRILVASAVLAATATLAACGDGGGPSRDAESETTSLTGPGDAPRSASESVSNFIGYLMRVVGLETETAEPVGVNGLEPPTSETEEPAPLT